MKNTLYIFISIALMPATGFAKDYTTDYDFYGEIGTSLNWQEDRDFKVNVHDLKFGLTGSFDLDNFEVVYKGELQHSTAAKENGYEAVDINEAKIILKHRYGTALIAAPGESGTYSDLYSTIDIHEVNNANQYTNDQLFNQARYAKGVVAYATPKWNGFQFKVGIVTPNDNTGRDDDVVRLALLYNKQDVKLGFNIVKSSKQLTNRDVDYYRYAISGQYKLDKLTIASLIELNKDCPTGDSNIYAVAAKYFATSNVEFRISQQYKDWNSDKENQQLTIGGIHYHFTNKFSTFIEGSHYSERLIKNKYTSDSNINLGFVLKM